MVNKLFKNLILISIISAAIIFSAVAASAVPTSVNEITFKNNDVVFTNVLSRGIMPTSLGQYVMAASSPLSGDPTVYRYSTFGGGKWYDILEDKPAPLATSISLPSDIMITHELRLGKFYEFDPGGGYAGANPVANLKTTPSITYGSNNLIKASAGVVATFTPATSGGVAAGSYRLYSAPAGVTINQTNGTLTVNSSGNGEIFKFPVRGNTNSGDMVVAEVTLMIGEGNLDKLNELLAEIDKARVAKKGIVVAESASKAPVGSLFVTPTVMATFELAIDTAQIVYNLGANAAACDQAIVSIRAATKAFEEAIGESIREPVYPDVEAYYELGANIWPNSNMQIPSSNMGKANAIYLKGVPGEVTGYEVSSNGIDFTPITAGTFSVTFTPTGASQDPFTRTPNRINREGDYVTLLLPTTDTTISSSKIPTYIRVKGPSGEEDVEVQEYFEYTPDIVELAGFTVTDVVGSGAVAESIRYNMLAATPNATVHFEPNEYIKAGDKYRIVGNGGTNIPTDTSSGSFQVLGTAGDTVTSGMFYDVTDPTGVVERKMPGLVTTGNIGRARQAFYLTLVAPNTRIVRGPMDLNVDLQVGGTLPTLAQLQAANPGGGVFAVGALEWYKSSNLTADVVAAGSAIQPGASYTMMVALQSASDVLLVSQAAGIPDYHDGTKSAVVRVGSSYATKNGIPTAGLATAVGSPSITSGSRWTCNSGAQVRGNVLWGMVEGLAPFIYIESDDASLKASVDAKDPDLYSFTEGSGAAFLSEVTPYEAQYTWDSLGNKDITLVFHPKANVSYTRAASTTTDPAYATALTSTGTDEGRATANISVATSGINATNNALFVKVASEDGSSIQYYKILLTLRAKEDSRDARIENISFGTGDSNFDDSQKIQPIAGSTFPGSTTGRAVYKSGTTGNKTVTFNHHKSAYVSYVMAPVGKTLPISTWLVPTTSTIANSNFVTSTINVNVGNLNPDNTLYVWVQSENGAADNYFSVKFEVGVTLSPVTITGTNASQPYDISGNNAAAMFTNVTAGAGAKTYSIASLGSGAAGTINASTGAITVTSAGTFTVKIDTAQTATHLAGTATAVLTVTKIKIPTPTITVKPELARFEGFIPGIAYTLRHTATNDTGEGTINIPATQTGYYDLVDITWGYGKKVYFKALAGSSGVYSADSDEQTTYSVDGDYIFIYDPTASTGLNNIGFALKSAGGGQHNFTTTSNAAGRYYEYMENNSGNWKTIYWAVGVSRVPDANPTTYTTSQPVTLAGGTTSVQVRYAGARGTVAGRWVFPNTTATVNITSIPSANITEPDPPIIELREETTDAANESTGLAEVTETEPERVEGATLPEDAILPVKEE